ncbi:hypothetical protein PG989_001254 [Apiospora arundinis]
MEQVCPRLILVTAVPITSDTMGAVLSKIPGVDRKKTQIPVADGTETWIYTPDGAQGPLPYIFYVHGGGFIAGSISVYDPIATDLVLRTGYALVFPEYKLAPEAQWPEQQEQCFRVLQWITQHGRNHNLINDKFAIVGDSAGGVLLSNMNIMAYQTDLKIPYNVLLSPLACLDYTGQPTGSQLEFWNGPFLTGPVMSKFIDAYLPASVNRASELVSPCNMSETTARAFAPTLIITSSADILRDGAEALVEVLQKAGCEAVLFRAHGQMHDTAVLEGTRNGPTPRTIMTLIAAVLRQRLG